MDQVMSGAGHVILPLTGTCVTIVIAADMRSKIHCIEVVHWLKVSLLIHIAQPHKQHSIHYLPPTSFGHSRRKPPIHNNPPSPRTPQSIYRKDGCSLSVMSLAAASSGWTGAKPASSSLFLRLFSFQLTNRRTNRSKIDKPKKMARMVLPTR